MTTAAAIEAEIAALLAAEAGDVDDEPAPVKPYRGPELDYGQYTPPDNGCRLHPSCLTCPRAICIYDEPEGARAALIQFRAGSPLTARVRTLIAEGKSNGSIAATLDCHATTVGRIRRAETGTGTAQGRPPGERRTRILAAHAAGRSAADIATDEGVSRPYVYRVRKGAA